MPIITLLRIKNESRWISAVVKAVRPLSEHVLVLDDHSTDDTPEICEREGARVFRSEFDGMDESRDKGWLLKRAFDLVPRADRNEQSPWWALAIDGDEELVAEDADLIRDAVERTGKHCYSLKILYLWDRPDQVRTDRVYQNFRRPSLFRLMNPAFNYKKTPFGNGANFHCSSIPQEILHHANPCEARLLHWGYIDRDLRLKKFDWYNRIDPNNHGEDLYRHCIQGDVPEIPPDMRLKHAGPMKLEPLVI